MDFNPIKQSMPKAENNSASNNNIHPNGQSDLDQFNNNPFQSHSQQKIRPVFLSEDIEYDSIPTVKPKNGRTLVGKFIFINLFILFLAASAFGFTKYQQYQSSSKTIPVLSLLPADPNLVLYVDINPNSEQFKLLESNLQKFPGYKDNVSEFINKKLGTFNIDFQKEFLPAIDSKVYFLITDLSPVSESLYHENYENLSLNAIENKKASNQTKESPLNKLDFISATQIKDISKAQELLKKLQTNGKFSTTIHNYKKYEYFEISEKNSDNKKMFATVAGMNLFVASSEIELKQILDKTDAITKLSLSNNQQQSLADNQDFKAVFESFGKQVSSNQMLSAYIKLNYSKFFKNNCSDSAKSSCQSLSDYFQYPEDLIAGLDIRFNADGIGMTVISNQKNIRSAENLPFANGMISKIPQKVNDEWTDLFAETASTKAMYYDFKQNLLTEKGREELTNTLDDINRTLNINVETELIDQINGSISLAAFTKEKTKPEAVLIIPIVDSVKMLDTMQKIVEAFKASLMKNYSFSLDLYNQQNTPQAINIKKEYQKKIDELKTTNLNSRDTSTGKIYSFTSPNLPISINFSLENNTLILASNDKTLETLLGSLNSSEKADSLIKNPLYVRSQAYAPTNGYSQSFLVTQGILNIASYVYQNGMQLLQQTNAKTEAKDNAKETDPFFPFSSVIKTVKFVRSSSESTDQKFMQTSIFLDLKEISTEEKARASKALEELKSHQPTIL